MEDILINRRLTGKKNFTTQL